MSFTSIITATRTINVIRKMEAIRIGIPKESIIYIYQGLITKQRGVEVILEAFSEIQPRLDIIFLGFGSAKNKVLEFSSNFCNIHYHPPVPPRELKKYTHYFFVQIFYWLLFFSYTLINLITFYLILINYLNLIINLFIK